MITFVLAGLLAQASGSVEAGPAGSAIDTYGICVVGHIAQSVPVEQLDKMTGRSIAKLVDETSRMKCREQRIAVVHLISADAPDKSAEQQVRVLNNTFAGMLADGPIEVVPTSVCTKQIKRDGSCL